MHLPTRLAPLLQRLRSHLKPDQSIPLLMLLTIPCMLQIVASVGIAGMLSFYYSQQDSQPAKTAEIADQWRQQTAPRIANQLDAQLKLPAVSRLNTTAIQANQSPTDFLALQHHFWQQLQHPTSTTVERVPQIGLVVAQSVHNQARQYIGVLIAGLSLAELSQMLRQSQAEQSSQVYIVERGALVAASTSEQPVWLKAGTEEPQRLAVSASRDPIIRAVAKEIGLRYGSFEQFDFNFNGEQQYVQVTPYLDKRNLDWLIVTTISSSALAGQSAHAILIILLLGLGLSVTIATTVYPSRKIAQPVLRLSKASCQLAQGKLCQAVDVGRVKELATLAQSFNQMSQEVQQSRAALEEYSQSLEQKVYERTQALEAEIRRRIAIEAVLHEANQELERLAFVDGLTQVANRRHFDDCFNQEWWRLRRMKAPLSIILCDIDYFKQYNDTYGHQAGDACLCKVAVALQSAAKRPADVVARYGGEEFAIVLPDTPAAGAMQVAREIQAAIRQLELSHQGSLVSPFVTLSMGIASIVPQAASSPQQVIASADRALYRAKSKGRNRIAVDNLKLENDDRRFA